MYLSTGGSNVKHGDSTVRQERIRSLVLTKDRFLQLKAAVLTTFEEFEAIIRGDSGVNEVITPISEIKERLENTEKEKWRNIRKTYLSDPYYGYVNGDFTAGEANDPCKLLLDIVKHCDQAHHSVLQKADELYDGHKKHKSEVRQLDAQVKTLTGELQEANWRCESSRKEVLNSRNEISNLYKELSEKRETINNLSRDGTVQIWQKEKERILADSKLQIQRLEESKVKLEAENDRMRRMMERKLALMDEQVRTLKMKQELATSKANASGISKDEINKLKNENYLLQKDLTVLEKELQREQVVFVGVLNGLRKDLSILTQKYKTQSYGEMLDSDMSKIQDRLDWLYERSLSGKIWTESEKLPVHYRDANKEVAVTKTKKLSNFGRSGRLSPIQRDEFRPTGLKNEDQGMESMKTNPQIVDPASERINSSIAMKHFPCISQDSIKEHWDHFIKFDSDGNNALDLQEVLRAIQTTIGFQFTPTQIEDCFKEVDVNKSNTIDFFEYLTITQLLINRNGQSEIFQSGVAKTKSSVVSKTCAIQ